MTMKNYYETSDLALASVIALFFPLDAIDRANPQKAHFMFERSKELEKLIEGYWKRELQIEPQVYFQSIKTLKGRLYSKD